MRISHSILSVESSETGDLFDVVLWHPTTGAKCIVVKNIGGTRAMRLRNNLAATLGAIVDSVTSATE